MLKSDKRLLESLTNKYSKDVILNKINESEFVNSSLYSKILDELYNYISNYYDWKDDDYPNTYYANTTFETDFELNNNEYYLEVELQMTSYVKTYGDGYREERSYDESIDVSIYDFKLTMYNNEIEEEEEIEISNEELNKLEKEINDILN